MNADPSQPTRQAIAAQDRSLPNRVTGRLRRAISEMVWSGACRADAARAAGMTDHSLRAALRKPHVIQHYRSELGVLRESTRAKVHHRLEELAMQDDHKAAAVKACQVLEQIADDPMHGGVRGIPVSPGLVIVVQGTSPLPAHDPGLVIDAEPPAPSPRPLWINGKDEPVYEDQTIFKPHL
jgi:hypothetical protein